MSLSDRWPLDELRRVLQPVTPWREPVLSDDLRTATVERAARAATKPFPALSASLFLHYFRTGARSNYEEAFFSRRRVLRDLVVGEAIEREGRFLDPIVDAVWATCEESWWGAPAHLVMQGGERGLPDPDDPVVDLYAGETAGALAWTMHLLGGELAEVAPAVVRRVRGEVRRRILEPCTTADFWWMGISDVGWMGQRGGPRVVNNWNPWICSNWIAGAVLLEDDPDRMARSVAKALLVLDQYLAVIPPDGSCEEGMAYWSRASGTLFEALELLYEASKGAIDIFDQPVIGELARFVPRMQLAGEWFVDFGDGSPRPEIPAGVLHRFGRRIGDASVCSLGAELLDAWRREGPHPNESVGRVLRSLEEVQEAVQGPRRSALPSFTWLPGDEVMVARDAPGTATGFAVAARGGHNGTPHGHNDIGTFIVVLDGEPLVIDAGVGTYTAETFGPRRFEIWTMRSGYHNVPLVAGTEQGAGQAYACTVEICTDRGNTAELVLDLTAAYPDEAAIARWDRRIALERNKGVLVTDTWRLQGEATVQLNLLLRDRPAVDAVTGALRYDAAVMTFEPPPAGIELERIPLDDPTLESSWERHELWRATATYPGAAAGSVRTAVARQS